MCVAGVLSVSRQARPKRAPRLRSAAGLITCQIQSQMASGGPLARAVSMGRDAIGVF